MHIPVSETKFIEIDSFAEALEKSKHPEEYDGDKWIYIPPFYTEYRYVLGTKGKNPLICVGINPSTARPDALDNTLKSAERIALNNGFDSFIMFNVYAQRATNPDDMEKEENRFLHEENLKAFRYILGLSEKPSVWAAWGTIVEKRDFLVSCMKEMVKIGKECNASWYKAGPCSKAGHPHHPLYLKSDSPIEPFDIDGYLELIK